jgi:diguanylate cyclase (GGDEF)-like protein
MEGRRWPRGTRHVRPQTRLPPRGERRVKDSGGRADRRTVIGRLPGDRRAATTPDVVRLSRLRRPADALRGGLYRPLAEDDDRAAYWVRHVLMGVVITEVAAWSVVGYAFLTDTPGRHHPVLLALAGLVILTVPGLLLLPLDAMMRDSRGPTLFYAWSVLTTVVVIIGTRMDGGSSSPLDGLLFLTLTFMAVAYPPYGVVAMGSVMTGGYFVFVELPDVTTSGVFYLTILASITMICALASANSWAAYDRQVMLIRTQETLAATDPLTGIPNRRAFLERVTNAVDDAAWGHQTVVCLVDLDGFKAVNDAGGHAAGDAMLEAVAKSLAGAVRETDTVARLGGDEFAVLADSSVSASGEMLAERLRAAVAHVGGGQGVTASVGVAEVEPGDDVGDLMHRADAAMYRSKTAGGNRVTTLSY